MTAQIIEFKTKAAYPTTREPTFSIDVYDNGDDAGFSWVLHGSSEPPTEEELQTYLGDMFLSLAGYEPPSIFQRAATFIRNLFHPGDKQ